MVTVRFSPDVVMICDNRKPDRISEKKKMVHTRKVARNTLWEKHGTPHLEVEGFDDVHQSLTVLRTVSIMRPMRSAQTSLKVSGEARLRSGLSNLLQWQGGEIMATFA
jgi:hypothetical protein